MTEKIKVQVCSDIDYDNLMAEIYIDGNFTALISDENASGEMEIKFPRASNTKAIELKVSLDAFEDALKLAKKKLHDL